MWMKIPLKLLTLGLRVAVQQGCDHVLLQNPGTACPIPACSALWAGVSGWHTLVAVLGQAQMQQCGSAGQSSVPPTQQLQWL